MMIVLIGLLCAYSNAYLLVNALSKNSSFPSTIKPPPEDDYYPLGYDYDLNNNSKDNAAIKTDSLILVPNPDDMEAKTYAVDVLPNVELPDDTLADPDLKDHNCIDNIMYVYYGGSGKTPKSYGSGIIIIGSVMSCAAQLLTLFCVLLKKYYKGSRVSMMLIVVHIFFSMFLSNLIFMLGVYATKNGENCLLIAILINIFHHHTAIWIFLYCLYIYKKFSRTWVAVIFTNVNWYTFATHLMPPLITLTTYYSVPKSFETKKFCFKSMHRGMILNFMIPICVLLILTTVYAISAMIKIENLEVAKLDHHYRSESFQGLSKELESLKERKDESLSYVDDELSSLKATRNCLKSICVMQLMFVLNWFITPVALDASHESTELPYLQSTTSMLLNWFMFYKRKTLLPMIDYAVEEISERDKLEEQEFPSCSATEVVSIASSDNVPLLKSDTATELKEFCTLAEVKEGTIDYISTIST
ncbi:adhesion G protein-coupled receptor B1-like [Euwallacea fornicatus]|uniref:adhesion G protein-coupled receptor B1-like n=1 Tax=Euwallacea fornicatus TaxID=995702 RepID=UPI00338FED43